MIAPVKVRLQPTGMFSDKSAPFNGEVTGFGKHPKTNEMYIFLQIPGHKLGLTIPEWDKYVTAIIRVN